jgi:hypothetical protein
LLASLIVACLRYVVEMVELDLLRLLKHAVAYCHTVVSKVGGLVIIPVASLIVV